MRDFSKTILGLVLLLTFFPIILLVRVSHAWDVSTEVILDGYGLTDGSVKDIAFNTDGTKMFVLGDGSDAVYEYALSSAFDVSTASFVDSFSVAGQEIGPSGLIFNADGTKMFVTGYLGDDINEYALSSAFDVSTASFVDSFSVAGQEIGPSGLIFNADGTKMFVTGYLGDDINEYALSSAFDVSTASFVDSFSVADQESNPQDVQFNTDGTKMFVVGEIGDDVNEYTLSTGFDVSTASFVDSFSVAGQEVNPTDMTFNADGTKMFILGDTGNDVNEYTLSTGFDVSTASFVDSFDVGSYETTPEGITFNTDGTKMFIVGTATDDVSEYTLSTGFDVSTASSDAIFSVSDQEINPEGLAFNTDGTKMFVTGSSGDDVNEYVLSTEFDASTASFVDSFSVADQETSPQDIVFNTDGTKMFVLGYTGKDVNEYTLSTGFDVSTASFVDSFSVADQESGPTDMAFNTDGTKMFVIGILNDAVNEYALSTGFDVSTASFVDSFVVANKSPRGLAFSSNGRSMLYVGDFVDYAYEYALSTGFDVSTASYVDSTVLVGNNKDITFSADGTKMFILNTNDYIVTYETIPYDVADPVISNTATSTTDTTATITWTTDEDASTRTGYGLTSTYTSYTTESDTSTRVTSHSDTLSDLTPCTTYHYGVYSEDASGNGATSTDDTLMTTGCLGGASVTTENTTNITTAGGGEASLTTGSAEITLTVPASFGESDTAFQVKQLDSTSVIGTTGREVSGENKTLIGSHTYQLTAHDTTTANVTSFDQPIVVSITYEDLEVSGIDEPTLRIYRWTGTAWQQLSGCSVNTDSNIISCNTSNFSVFSLLGDLETAIVIAASDSTYVQLDLSYSTLTNWLLEIARIIDKIQQLEDQQEYEEASELEEKEVSDLITEYEEQTKEVVAEEKKDDKEINEIEKFREEFKILLLQLIDILTEQVQNMSANIFGLVKGSSTDNPCPEEESEEEMLRIREQIRLLLLQLVNIIEKHNMGVAAIEATKSKPAEVPCNENAKDNKGQGQEKKNEPANSAPQNQGQERAEEAKPTNNAGGTSSGGGGGGRKINANNTEVSKKTNEVAATKARNKIAQSLNDLKEKGNVKDGVFKKQLQLLKEAEELDIDNTISILTHSIDAEIKKLDILALQILKRIERLERKYPNSDFSSLKKDLNKAKEQLREAEYLIDLINLTIDTQRNEDGAIPEKILEEIQTTLDKSQGFLEELFTTLGSISNVVGKINVR